MKFNLSKGRIACVAVFLVFLPMSLSGPMAVEKKTVGLLPVVLHADPSKAFLRSGIQSMLVSRLEGEGLSVLHGSQIEKHLQDRDLEGVDSGDRAREIAQQLGIDYIIFGSITTLGEGFSLDYSILDLTGEEPKQTQVAEAVDESQLIPRLSDMAHQFRAVVEGIDFDQYQAMRQNLFPSGETAKGLLFRPGAAGHELQPAGRSSVRLGVLSFDAGDLNDDGNLELLFMTRKSLFVFHREDDTFILKDTLEAGLGDYFLKVSVGDADQDGKDEIYLVSNNGGRARSTVFDWDGSFKERLSMWGHLRVDAARQGRPPFLYFQDTMIGRYFKGDIFIMGYESRNKLARKNALPDFEKGAQFYTIIQYDLDGDGYMEFIGLNDLSYLHVWDQLGKSLWASGSKMGGTNNAETITPNHPELPSTRIPFNSRVAIMDIDEDGTLEVLAFRNIPIIDHLTNLKIYDTSRLYAYKIKGNTLSSEWSTGKMKYSITDLKVHKDTLYLAFLEGKFSKLSEPRGRVMWFE